MVASMGSHPALVNGPLRLAWLTALTAPTLIAGGVYAVTGDGLPCPLLAATGWLCPLCGGSHMAAALLDGDLSRAWGWNPFALALMTGLGLVWLWTAVRVIAGRPAGLPGVFARLDRLRPVTMLWLILMPAIVFGVVRNVA